MPQSLEEKYGGYLSHSFVNDLKDYSDFCFKTFGDRIKHWVTINEPKILSLFGYENGWAPPGRCSLPNMGCTRGGNSSTEPYIAAHNLILAHAAVYKLYQEKYQEEQGGEVGIALNINYYEPYDSISLEDQAAAKRLLDFHLGWFVEPLVFGDYPKTMRELVKDRLPIFSEEQKVMLKGAYDFLGINYYLSSYAQNKPNSRVGVIPHHAVDALALELDSKNGVRLGYPETGGYPNGLRKLLEFIKEKYQEPKIYICENGVKENENSRPREESLNDLYRITFLLRHLNAVNKAIKNGVNVKGYYIWSVFDDFEWGTGLKFKYGLYYIDFENKYKRIPKLSAKWYLAFLKGKKN
ncbi:beta-glucosidase 11-like [Ziziphus jujuba]|uniref:Beta-glucosidase 11-like n=1 Tax=Ziziphus jujuba TaxID=326968 RepID=A0ABM3IKT8_ZIZJJ|nr:beta-glucosidase 11-like [Ziziphus jujuba]